MWFARRIVVGCALVLCVNCSDDGEEGDKCTLPKKPEFEVTATTLQTNASHANCPKDVPVEFSSAQLEAEGICAQEITDCVIHLDCEIDGLTVEAKLAERGGNLVGRVDVTKPITCVYELTGNFL
jgi:hypothetical protein